MATDKKKISSLYSGTATQQKKPGGYNAPKFEYKNGKIKKLYDELMSRKDFTFDLNGNALYNQLKDVHVKQGQLAMQDTIGQAAAMTGGYGNSYAASAGQQAYQQSLDSLNEKVPEIYQLALEQYQLEGQNLMDKYGIAVGERDFAYGQYRDDRDFEYQKHRDAVADSQWQDEYDYRKNKDERDFEYQKDRDAVADSHWKTEFDYNAEQDKIKNEQWQKEFDERKRQWTEEQKLAFKKFAEEIRQFNLQYELSEKEFEEMCRQWAEEHDLDEKTLAEDIRQFNLSYELDEQALEEEIRHNTATENKNAAAPVSAGDVIDDSYINELSDEEEADAYPFGFPGYGEDGDFSEEEYAVFDKVMYDIENLGMANDPGRIKEYLSQLVSDGVMGLALYKAIKESLGIE